MIEVNKLVEEFSPRAIEIWKRLHANPELSMQEHKTHAFLTKIIEEEVAYDRILHVGETGILVEIVGTKPGDGGKTIGVRGDMDALPIQEDTGLDYASKVPGVMHACGHDVHTTFTLSTLMLLSRLKSEFSGKVKFFFQPAEENLMGAKLFLNDPQVGMEELDGIFSLHVIPDLYAGQISTKKGPVLASADKLNIKVHGKGCHAAHPQLGIDPVVIAANIIMALQTILSRSISALENGIVTIAQLRAGEAHNIIPDTVEMTGTIRATKPETRVTIHKLVTEMAQKIADSYSGSAEVFIEEGVPPLRSDAEWVDRAFRVGNKLLGEGSVIEQEFPAMGGEDFAFLKGEIPGVFIRIGTRGEGKPFTPTHSPFYCTDEKAIAVGIKVMLGIIFDYFGREYA